MNDYWKEWINNKVYLLSTPTGAIVGAASFIIGLLLGKIIQGL